MCPNLKSIYKIKFFHPRQVFINTKMLLQRPFCYEDPESDKDIGISMGINVEYNKTNE